jgi:aminoglycoside 3-N-acetyltransferase
MTCATWGWSKRSAASCPRAPNRHSGWLLTIVPGRLVEEVPWHEYYGPGSTLERLIRAHGKVLRLGGDLNTLTLLHYAEYLVPLESKRRTRRHRLVVGPDGNPIVREVECLDNIDGIVDSPGEDYFALILKAYLSSGRASTGVVGGAQSELIDAVDVVDFGVSWMTLHLGA